MEKILERYMGIHPGKILDRVLKKRGLNRVDLALTLQVDPRLLDAIIMGEQGMVPGFSVKVDAALGFELGTMDLLQQGYVNSEQLKLERSLDRPDLRLLRKALFWDTDIEKLDWREQYVPIIKRIFERGNYAEKQVILEFYGKDKIKDVTGSSEGKDHIMPIFFKRPRE